MSIEAWVTTPASVYIATLDRSSASPFRGCAFSVVRNAAGVGSLEYARPNALLTAHPTLFDAGNLVWMRYRGKTVVWVIEQSAEHLEGEGPAWVTVTGPGALALLGDRLVLPDAFSDLDLDPSVWGRGPALATLQDRDSVAGTRVVLLTAAEGDRFGIGQRVAVNDTGAVFLEYRRIAAMRLNDAQTRWIVTLDEPLTYLHGYGSGWFLYREGGAASAAPATTLTVAATAGDRRITVASAKRLHHGQRILISETGGTTGEWAIVRDVEHRKARAGDSTVLATAASAGQPHVIITGKHFREGQSVTITGGGNNETHEILDRLLYAASPLQWKLTLDADLTHAYSTGAAVARAAIDERWRIVLRRGLENSYALPPGADVSRPSDLWHTVVAMSAGEVIEELVTDSNARVASQITIGTIETDLSDDDQWTKRYRFENVLEEVGAITEAYGDVTMSGLALSYWTSLGSDLSASVIFEEGMDILRIGRDRNVREQATWVVAEGLGEGAKAKFALASDDTAPRRRERWVDGSEATSLAQLQALADKEYDAGQDTATVSLDVAETYHEAFTDFDVGDTVGVRVPSRGIDSAWRVEAIYIAETDDEVVRMSMDVSVP